MRIAFFSDMLVRDHDGCMRTMFHILDRRPGDIEIKFFTGSESSLEAVKVPDVRLPFNKDYKMALPFMKLTEMNKSLKEFKPDLIHIASPSALGSFAANYGKRNGIKVSTIYHTHYLSYIHAYLKGVPALIPLMRKAMSHQLRSFYNSCDLVLVPTEIIRNELSTIGILEYKMKLWARGLDKSIFNPEARDTSWLQSKVQNDLPNVLYAGRLVWEKNLETLIRIYKEREKRGSQFNLLVAGDGSAREALEAAMPKAFFLGAVNQQELAGYYASSDLFVFPSVSETYGNVVVEAMASGLPCIIGDGGGTTTFIEQGKTGWKVPAYDEAAYLDKIELMLDDNALYDYIQQAGYTSTAGMDWDSLVSDFFAKIKKLVEQERRLAA